MIWFNVDTQGVCPSQAESRAIPGLPDFANVRLKESDPNYQKPRFPGKPDCYVVIYYNSVPDLPVSAKTL